jgi:ribosomal protein S18 acetylase RimI-like enzyme
VYRRSELPRLLEQQVHDFGRIVWSDGLMTEGVSSVMTYPAFRGEGHSSALLRRAASHIEASGMDFGMLFCDEHNVSFYERLGWQVLDRGRVRVREDPDGDDHQMVLGDDHLLPDTAGARVELVTRPRRLVADSTRGR